MDFAFNEDQEELRRYVRQWLEEKSPSSVIREQMSQPTGLSHETWKQLAEMGWQSMVIPEEFGGAGFGLLELAVILEEQGRALFVGPFLSNAVATQLIMMAGTEEQKADVLPRIAAGEITATIAIADAGGRPTAPFTAVEARQDGGDWLLEGIKRFVVDGESADLAVVGAHTTDGPVLFLVDRSAYEVSPLPTMDQTRRQADQTFAGSHVPATAQMDAEANRVGQAAETLTNAAVAIESVGATARCLDMAVEYAKERKQFSRPIGSFQSIKHMCADMLISLEAARAAAYYAVWAVNEDPHSHDAAESSAIAKAYCTEAFYACAAQNIQIHGGIGFTWEHDAHLYFKRAKSSQLMFGSALEHRKRLAQLIGL